MPAPAPKPPEMLSVEPPQQPHYPTLRAALHHAARSPVLTPAQHHALAEIRLHLPFLADPLSPSHAAPPRPHDRSRLALSDLTIAVATPTDPAPTPVRLGPDLVSVALALADELQLNELDAAVLLYEARPHAARRPDHDVVAAAKHLFAARRRDAVLYLQDIVRAGLMDTARPAEGRRENDDNNDNNNDDDDDDDDDDAFVPLLMRERDALVVEHRVFANVVARLSQALDVPSVGEGGKRNREGLQAGEFALLAETLFLLAYTVQVSSVDALVLRGLLDRVDAAFQTLARSERQAAARHGRLVGATKGGDGGGSGSGASGGSGSGNGEDRSMREEVRAFAESMSPQLVEVESVRNLIFLAWTCALDRSRYHDVYDPSTGKLGVNALLKDLAFIPRTSNVPKLAESGDDDVSKMTGATAAAELCGAVFRLAVAAPDEDEALLTALRVSAYAGALDFMSRDLASWVSSRAGSLGPDADLYADVIEDLALDVAEAPQLASSLIQFTENEVYAAASQSAYASYEGGSHAYPSSGSGIGALNTFAAGHRLSDAPLGSPPGVEQSPNGGRRMSAAGAAPRSGRPPRPPSGRSQSRPASVNVGGMRPGSTTPVDWASGATVQFQRTADDNVDVKPHLGKSRNLIASLATFVAEAVRLAPSKLAVDSIGGGARYWSGIGQVTPGLVQQIGDSVIDLWDASMRNPYAAGGVGEAFREALIAFLLLLASTSRKEGSPSHASSALQFLRDSGQSAVSLDRALEAMSYFHTQLSSSSSPQGRELDDADVDALQGIVNVIATAAEALRPHGGIMLVLGDQGKELAMRMASLAVHEIRPSLRDSLLHAVSALDNRKAISLCLEALAGSKAAPLRRFVRGTEAQTGTYDLTIRVLNLAAQCTSWGDDEFPEATVECITTWFATEEVLTYWTRRKYVEEAHRWRVLRAAAGLIQGFVCRNPNSERSFRVLARLLTPAPGTGAASYALRALLCASGLMRAGDGKGSGFQEYAHFLGHWDNQTQSLYHIAGRDCLVHAAEHGLGDAYREMQLAAQTAARIISLILSIPSGRISVPGVVVAPAAELLLGEVKAIGSAASLVFAANESVPAISRAGYSPSLCSAVLGMLANAAHESVHIASILTRDAPGTVGSASEFRSSLANIISRSTSESFQEVNADVNLGHSGQKGQAASKLLRDPPIMHSALRIVEACLGVDGGSAPGMFLLGLQLDSAGLYTSSQYGVLSALVELVAGAHDASGRIDDRSRSTAATFLERLAANTVRRTSLAVLEHLREIARPGDPAVRGCGFGDEMLFRILEAVGSTETTSIPLSVDWAALGELLAACLSLSAMQVRLFPRYEQEACLTNAVGLHGLAVSDGSRSQMPNLPSPLDLLKVLSLTAGSGELQIAFEALRTWTHLLGTRLAVHPPNSGYSSVPVLFELISALLGALAGADGGNDLSELVRKDGGEITSALILLCITRMRDCDNPYEPGSEEYIGDVQCSAILTGVVRALASVVGIGADACRARTSLYAALLVCGNLAKSRLSDDAICRTFGGKLGPRQVSGTEAVVAVACLDAVSGPTAAAKATAMAATAVTTLLDPARAMPALGTQNRLRRVVQASLTDPEAIDLLSQATSKGSGEVGDNTSETARERAAIAVAESAFALIHAVSAAGHGARVIADSGCIESAASLLPALSLSGLLSYERMDGEATGNLAPHPARTRPRFNHVAQTGAQDQWRYNESEDEIGNNFGQDDEAAMDLSGEQGAGNEGEGQIAMVASVTGAIAAAVCCAHAAVMDSTLNALEEGKQLFSDLLRGLKSSRGRHLEAVSALGMILSRIPYELLAAAASATQLRMSLAAALGAIVPRASNKILIGGSGSPFSAGITLRKPEDRAAARRASILHPEGGSLFERDLISSRVSCLLSVIAALRNPAGLLFLFIPRLGDKARIENGAGTARRPLQAEAIGRLSEVARICSATLSEIQRSAEESMQMDTRIAGETSTSISARRIDELADFCQEQHGVDRESLNGGIVIECMKKASGQARSHTHACISIFESTLFILREYVRTARETVRGEPLARGERVYGGDVKGDMEPEEDGATMEIADAAKMLADAKHVLVPICNEVEGLAGGVWGGKDASFSKQLCRQIRTACTGSGDR